MNKNGVEQYNNKKLVILCPPPPNKKTQLHDKN